MWNKRRKKTAWARGFRGNKRCVCLLTVGVPSAPVCDEGQWACNDGSKCIGEMDRCDFFQDCDDNSDEENCDEVTCAGDEFLCDDLCLPTSYWCDGVPDCSDGSDETSCKLCCGYSGVRECMCIPAN